MMPTDTAQCDCEECRRDRVLEGRQRAEQRRHDQAEIRQARAGAMGLMQEQGEAQAESADALFVERVARELCGLDGIEPDLSLATAGALNAPFFIQIAGQAAVPIDFAKPAWRFFETRARNAIRAVANLGVSQSPLLDPAERSDRIEALARIIAVHRGGKNWNGIVTVGDRSIALRIARLSAPLHPLPLLAEAE